MNIDSIVARIRSRTREEWEQVPRSLVIDLRIWIQENAEKAAVGALAVGILFVLAFKLIVGLVFLAGVIGYVIWSIALPGDTAAKVPSSSTDSGTGGSTETRDH